MQPKQFMAMIGQQTGETGRNSKYDPEHCHTVRMMAQDGEFPEAWIATIGVQPETMRRWASSYPEFRAALIEARILLQTYWTREIAKNRHNPRAQPALYNLIARRFRDLYGREGGVDLVQWMTQPATVDGSQQPAGVGSTAAQPVTAMSDDALQRRLSELRARDSVNSEGSDEPD